MVTRNGVHYDLAASPIMTESNGIRYRFSSLLHKQKFDNAKLENRISLNRYLAYKLHLRINLERLPDLALYAKIETRGFCIESVEGGSLCLDLVKFDSQKKMLQDYPRPSETSTRKSTE